MRREITLSDGTKMPIFGLGTWKSELGKVYDAVREAIRVGYRHIDCAAIYGNEAEVGRALQDALPEAQLRREDLWITSKLWNDAHAPERVRPALEQTLADLRLEYLDLYLIHWPVAQVPGTTVPTGPEQLVSWEELPLATTWEALLELKSAGLARQVGVSNFSLAKVQRVRDAVGEGPAVNQVELHPYLQQESLVAGCRALGTAITAYSPLGSPDSAEMLGREDREPLLENETITQIAKLRDASPGQVLIAWALHRETSTIPKSTNPKRIRENFGALELELTDDDLNAIRSLDRHLRMVDGSLFTLGRGYSHASLWDEPQ